MLQAKVEHCKEGEGIKWQGKPTLLTLFALKTNTHIR